MTIGQKFSHTADATIIKVHALINELSTTGWIIFTGTLASLGTALWYWLGTVFSHRAEHQPWAPEPVTFGMWLGFLAAWMGIGYKQFKVKRETYDKNKPDGTRPSGSTTQAVTS